MLHPPPPPTLLLASRRPFLCLFLAMIISFKPHDYYHHPILLTHFGSLSTHTAVYYDERGTFFLLFELKPLLPAAAAVTMKRRSIDLPKASAGLAWLWLLAYLRYIVFPHHHHQSHAGCLPYAVPALHWSQRALYWYHSTLFAVHC